MHAISDNGMVKVEWTDLGESMSFAHPDWVTKARA